MFLNVGKSKPVYDDDRFAVSFHSHHRMVKGERGQGGKRRKGPSFSFRKEPTPEIT